jgi:hypothetical protein
VCAFVHSPVGRALLTLSATPLSACVDDFGTDDITNEKASVSSDSPFDSNLSFGTTGVASGQPRTLFIGSVAPSVTQEDLFSLCQKLARVESVTYVLRHTGMFFNPCFAQAAFGCLQIEQQS